LKRPRRGVSGRRLSPSGVGLREEPGLVESGLHAFLKRVGAAFLLNQGCFLVDTEVPLSRTGRTHELDDHRVVDVCGVGERFFEADRELLMDYAEPLRVRHEVKRNVLRGVEVKVSRSDFRNGFYCSGCNYNYLLTPMKLVSPWELPKGVGLVEYNRYKFSVELAEERFAFRGLRVVKKGGAASDRQRDGPYGQAQTSRRPRGPPRGARGGPLGERIRQPMTGAKAPPAKYVAKKQF
jgi:hypothetical protein